MNRPRQLAALAAALLVTSLAAAQQPGTVRFDPPVVDATHDPATAVQLSRDGVVLGDVTNGQTIANLFPTNTGTWVFSFVARNQWGPGPPVQVTVTLGAPKPPGPVINIVIEAACAVAVPPTCSVNITGP